MWLWVSDHTIMIIWVMKIFFCIVLLCTLATASWYLLLLLGPLLCPSLHELILWYLKFSWRSLVFSILFSPLYFFALITEKAFLISPCYSLELCIQVGISFLFSFALSFSSFFSYLYGLLRQSSCLFVFLFLGDGLDHCLLYNVMNLCP